MPKKSLLTDPARNSGDPPPLILKLTNRSYKHRDGTRKLYTNIPHILQVAQLWQRDRAKFDTFSINVRTSSMTPWKAHYRLRIRCNLTYFSLTLTVQAI